MTIAQTASLVLLFLCLLLAIWRRLNIGVVALGAALVIIPWAGADVNTMYKAFPGSVFVLLVGVSLLFAHMERSGAIQWLVEKVFGMVGEHDVFIPWAGFVLAGALSTAGAFSTGVIALLVPLIAHITSRLPRSFYVSELAIVIGANCCGLSPLNPTGQLVHTIASKKGVVYSTWGIWAVSAVTAAVVVAALQVIDAVRGRRDAAYRPSPAAVALPAADALDENGRPRNMVYAVTSGLALAAFVILVVVFKTDVGITAMALVAIMQVVFHPKESELIHRVPWGATLLLCGLLTYLGLMQQIGTMDSIQHALTHVGSKWLLVLVLAYLTALLCNIESSTLGVLGLVMPLVCAAFGTSPVIFGVIAAVAVPAALMVMNPIHVAGTLIVANSVEHQQPGVFKHLLGVAITLALITPGLLSLVPIAGL